MRHFSNSSILKASPSFLPILKKFLFVMKEKLSAHNAPNSPWEVRLHQILTPLEIAQVLLVNYFEKDQATKSGVRTSVIEWMIFNTSLWGLRISESANLLCGQIHLIPVLEKTQSSQNNGHLTQPVLDLLKKLTKEGKPEQSQGIKTFLYDLAVKECEEITSHIDLKSTKYSMPRDVYIGPLFAKFLQEYLTWKKESGEPVESDSPFFFCPYRKEKNRGFYTPQGLRKSFKRAIQKSGIFKEATPHIGRHTFASNMATKDIKRTQKQLGHRNLATTNIYTHLLDSKNKEFVSSYEKIVYAGLETIVAERR